MKEAKEELKDEVERFANRIDIEAASMNSTSMPCIVHFPSSSLFFFVFVLCSIYPYSIWVTFGVVYLRYIQLLPYLFYWQWHLLIHSSWELVRAFMAKLIHMVWRDGVGLPRWIALRLTYKLSCKFGRIASTCPNEDTYIVDDIDVSRVFIIMISCLAKRLSLPSLYFALSIAMESLLGRFAVVFALRFSSIDLVDIID